MSPSKINVFRSFEVVLAFVLQLWLEHSELHYSSLYGLALLLSAIALTGFETEVMAKYSERISFL